MTKEVSKWRAWHAMAAFLDLRRLLLHALQGMRQGIITSGAFILFLSAGILTRPFCRFLILDGALCARACSNTLSFIPNHAVMLCATGQFEIRQAIAHKKPLVLIRESDQSRAVARPALVH